MSMKSLMKSLSRKIKGYGDEPDLTSDYVVKMWETLSQHYEYTRYHYTIYRVTPSEPNGLKELYNDFSYSKKATRDDIRKRLRVLRSVGNTTVRWYP